MNIFNSVNAFGWTQIVNDFFPETLYAVVSERVRPVNRNLKKYNNNNCEQTPLS